MKQKRGSLSIEIINEILSIFQKMPYEQVASIIEKIRNDFKVIEDEKPETDKKSYPVPTPVKEG